MHCIWRRTTASCRIDEHGDLICCDTASVVVAVAPAPSVSSFGRPSHRTRTRARAPEDDADVHRSSAALQTGDLLAGETETAGNQPAERQYMVYTSSTHACVHSRLHFTILLFLYF